jgi:hypothetical protein
MLWVVLWDDGGGWEDEEGEGLGERWERGVGYVVGKRSKFKV